MKSPFHLHPPKNWQDFETLCLKLWGEIWNIPHEIEFNSDNAQGQQGVDIYGPVDNGRLYYGIQCKNKKLNLIDGTPNRITKADIEEEINKAKSFTPALGKLTIATSLPKDGQIEAYVRQQSAEHAQNGLFTIQICFWEFFERKLPEFPKVYDWYVKNEDFHRTRAISVLFQDEQEVLLYQPKFQKTVTRFVKARPQDKKVNVSPFDDRTIASMSRSEFFASVRSYNAWPKKEWRQFCWFRLSIKNTGQHVLEDLKLELAFEGDVVQVGAKTGDIIFNPGFKNDVKEYSNSKKDLWIEPFKRTLVQDDGFITGKLFVEPTFATKGDIQINWKLLSRDFSDTGTLSLKIVPLYYLVNKEVEVDALLEEKEELIYSYIERPATSSLNGRQFLDKEEDYSFIEEP